MGKKLSNIFVYNCNYNNIIAIKTLYSYIIISISCYKTYSLYSCVYIYTHICTYIPFRSIPAHYTTVHYITLITLNTVITLHTLCMYIYMGKL